MITINASWKIQTIENFNWTKLFENTFLTMEKLVYKTSSLLGKSNPLTSCTITHMLTPKVVYLIFLLK
jgi:hypothetical protein